MKKLLSFALMAFACVAFCAEGPGTYFTPKAGEGNAVTKVAARPDSKVHMRISFLGGSITEMHGFRPRVMNLLRSRYPLVDFEEVAAGLSSTCSDTGAFRLEEDVLSKGVPDLFVVESAVNDDQDGHFDYEHCVRGLEGIVRHVRRVNPKCDIVIGLMVNKGGYLSLLRGVEPIPYKAGKAVAAHYGAMLANVGEALVASEAKGGMTWEKYRDCHPSAEGCDFVADVIMKSLEGNFDPMGARKVKPLPVAMDVMSYAGGKVYPFSKVELGEAWKVSRPDWDRIDGNKRSYFTVGDALWCETVGGEATVRFSGSALAAFLTAGPDAGALEVSVDGAPFVKRVLRANYGKLHYPYTEILADGLSSGEHVARLRVASVAREGKACSVVRIHRLYVNETCCAR